MQLAHYTQGRNNNFHLIRLVAALLVLLSHSFLLATGTGKTEPFRADLGMTVGSVAVDIFFLTSGFLVTASLLTRRKALTFIRARVLRIYPALWAMLFITVFFLGGALSSLPLGDYLRSSTLISYLAKGSLGIMEWQNSLPGVFSSNPFGPEFNGPLWTLKYEVGMYVALLALWLTFSALQQRQIAAFKWSVLGLCTLAGLYLLVGYFRHGLPIGFEPHRGYTLSSLCFMFFTGATFYVLRHRIILSGKYFLALLAILLLASLNRHSFYVAYLLTLAYLLFYLAYVPSGWYRAFNRLGDYSYGVYIYAFPVQQTIVAMTPGISVTALCLSATGITLILAALSWHLIEAPALKLKVRA